jgi:hypothetical protein
MLERDGFEAAVAAEAIAGLPAEAERARNLLERSGGGVKGLRRLAARGFGAGTLDDLSGFADEA